MGRKEWDMVRKAAYASTGFTCVACGKEGRLEAHEYWNVNYFTGVCTVESIEPLCKMCHTFIHSGRLYKVAGEEISMEYAIIVLERGFKILADNNLKCFPGTLEVAEEWGCNTHGVEAYEIKENPNIEWEDWKLVYNGEVYEANSEEEWLEKYG